MRGRAVGAVLSTVQEYEATLLALFCTPTAARIPVTTAVSRTAMPVAVSHPKKARKKCMPPNSSASLFSIAL